MAASKTRGVTTVSEFLRERRVPEEVINRLEEEKIDKDVIPLMEDGDLAKYISSYGDRLALLNFCKAQKTMKTQKMGLFEKLRAKLQMRKESDANKTTDKDSVPKATEEGVLPVPKRRRGKASHRTIEIGWLHCENGQVKHIRAKYGGGTRAVLIGVQCGIDTVLQKGKELFFPNGISTKGHESHFNFEVWDYKQNPVQDNLTIGLIYDTLCMSRLRFYIATFPKKDVEDDGTPDNAVIKVLENSEQINDDDQDVLLLDDVYVVQVRECDAGQERNINFQEENDSLPQEQDDGSLHNITEVYSMDYPSLTQPDYHGDTSTNLIYDEFNAVLDCNIWIMDIV
ncbi:uncharacterized protein LOC118562359 [Fundulus heteroclitus]|uniref:uncharacterized protein LOC118562359 n=1 Tax=Fundulus heteroclitus TaxID=8078 RepID=UPI00165C3EF3|nr:uncharacterized protein LOC118562359 [Fundulus heteroclitus]